MHGEISASKPYTPLLEEPSLTERELARGCMLLLRYHLLPSTTPPYFVKAGSLVCYYYYNSFGGAFCFHIHDVVAETCAVRFAYRRLDSAKLR